MTTHTPLFWLLSPSVSLGWAGGRWMVTLYRQQSVVSMGLHPKDIRRAETLALLAILPQMRALDERCAGLGWRWIIQNSELVVIDKAGKIRHSTTFARCPKAEWATLFEHGKREIERAAHVVLTAMDWVEVINPIQLEARAA